MFEMLGRLWVIPWKNTTLFSGALLKRILVENKLDILLFWLVCKVDFHVPILKVGFLHMSLANRPRMEDAAFQKKSSAKIYKIKELKTSELEAMALSQCVPNTFSINSLTMSFEPSFTFPFSQWYIHHAESSGGAGRPRECFEHRQGMESPLGA